MANTGPVSPFIKDEPEDSLFGSNHQQQGFTMSQQQHHHHHFDQFGDQHHTGAGDDSIDPSELTMQTSSMPMQNGNNFMQSYPSFGSQQNLAYMNHSGIADDELLDLGNLDGPNGNPDDFNNISQGYGGQHSGPNNHGSVQHIYTGQDQPTSLSMNQQGPMNQMFSNTPDGAPIQSPFIQQNFNYDQFRQMPHPAYGQHPEGMAYNASRMHGGTNDVQSGSFENSYITAKPRSKMHSGLERKASQSRSPMTPKTPGMGVGNLNLGTPESGSLPSQPIHTHQIAQHRHQKSLSNQWDSTPGSLQSFVDSPISSPGQPSHHAQISEILKSGKHASLPAKVENGHHVPPQPAFQTQEAKRRRRRESHNMVERRRRDNINERIQELSHLVPHHRLEDEKVRKHLVNNSPLSPTLGVSGMSPPQATSLLAGGNGRRAAGNITTGIPVEEKDKGPNKGDILNGAVGWTRDLMWALHAKMQQEASLAEYIQSLGGTFPFEQTEEDKRMRTELLDAMEKNDASTFSYSRGPGSGLRVPKHTNMAGEPNGAGGQNSTMSPQSMSPTNHSASSGPPSVAPGQYWSGQHSGDSGQDPIDFKEEDEYGMDMT
ncbi:MAG: hypothetical protein M1824_000874 [Vezdaea acicularis]|nr:MAG: hypothetical protein M1824_000874 [Vezdaea acicularis]